MENITSDTGYDEIPYPIENHMYLFDTDIQKRFITDLMNIARNQEVQPHNFEEFLKGRFGSTLYDLYFQPYNEKVWRRNLKLVPLSWLEGKLPMPTVEEMIFNNINHIKEKAFVHATFWYEKKMVPSISLTNWLKDWTSGIIPPSTVWCITMVNGK